MSRTLSLGLLFALLCAAATSCISPPDFSDTPRIKFENLDIVRLPNPPGFQTEYSDTIRIYFEDGNGDLGLSTTDTMPPYDRTVDPVTKEVNENYYNYFVQTQIKNPSTGDWEDYVATGLPAGVYNSRYPRLAPESDKEAPLKGTLKFNTSVTVGPVFPPGSEIRYRVSIKDRALNRSNEIFTSSHVIER